MPKEENKGNSEVEQALSGSSKAPDSSDFFQQLENDVNGVVADNNIPQTEQVTPQQVDPVSSGENVGNVSSDEIEILKKRYSDSSREAQRMKAQLNEMKPFNALLTAMKNDSGLVDHVKGYFENGGQTPQTLQNKLNLSEDFVFDSNEAMTDPNSESAKVMNEVVNNKVQQKMTQTMAEERRKQAAYNRARKMSEQEVDFKKRHNMTDEDFVKMKEVAQKRVLTLDDVYYLINKDKVSNNVAQNTKADMLNQMKNVRNIPTSQSGTNSAETAKSPDANIFEGILGLDEEADNLFG